MKKNYQINFMLFISILVLIFLNIILLYKNSILEKEKIVQISNTNKINNKENISKEKNNKENISKEKNSKENISKEKNNEKISNIQQNNFLNINALLININKDFIDVLIKGKKISLYFDNNTNYYLHKILSDSEYKSEIEKNKEELNNPLIVENNNGSGYKKLPEIVLKEYFKQIDNIEKLGLQKKDKIIVSYKYKAELNKNILLDLTK